MKPLHTLILSLLSTQLIYGEIKDILVPNNIQTQLCQKLSAQGCNKERTLSFDNYFTLDTNRVLLFSHLERTDSLYSHGYTNIPIIVENKHKWQIINHKIEAEIQNVLRDPYGGIWIHALWMIEGVSPLLYYSKNGIKWQQIKLPKEEGNHGTFEDLEICFLRESLQLRFNNLDNTEETKIWESPYKPIIEQKASWKRVNIKNISKEKCFKDLALNKTIISSIAPREIPKKKAILKPITDVVIASSTQVMTKDTQAKENKQQQTVYFSLQLGTFKQKSSLDTLYTQMNQIPNTLIQRDFIVNGETIYKLFIGYFINYNEAKNELRTLRKKYPDNKILKNAFITKLK